MAGALWWVRLKRPVAVQLPTPHDLSRGSNLAGALVPSEWSGQPKFRRKVRKLLRPTSFVHSVIIH